MPMLSARRQGDADFEARSVSAEGLGFLLSCYDVWGAPAVPADCDVADWLGRRGDETGETGS